MDFLGEMNYFYLRMSLNELRMMNRQDYSSGVSYHSMLCLNVIANTENCTISKLAEALQITKSGVTIKVNELVKKGLVEKVQSVRDKRIHYLKLNPNISAIYGMFDRIGQNMEETLRKKYTENELSLFSGMLHTIADCDWRSNGYKS
ncbi:regulatory protein MarR [Syntrophobotulus glycolicus DSM 8271]|uniref:Regulatory protein MarR n=1 Tax=Syntrophobotulus glycolicus (strain DSM 8271 / FlGlyR) TaxID=645991 RepID=F0SZ28_SYNGF|nr:MarR family transcriptional regulator [Syntrophobotulus glycolicus]ADY57146.1 regulatory protein MarR [Syntrophobotulus glycolicus DSM 8271]